SCILGYAETPRQRAVFVQNVIADAQAGPVEIAVVPQTCASASQLSQQHALCGCGHAVGAYHRGTAASEFIGRDSEQIGVLTDEHIATSQVPAGRRSHQKAQRGVTWLTRHLCVTCIAEDMEIQEHGRSRQLIDQYSGLGPDIPASLVADIAY